VHELHAVLELQLIVHPPALELELIDLVLVLLAGDRKYVRTDEAVVDEQRRVAVRPEPGRIRQAARAHAGDAHIGAVRAGGGGRTLSLIHI